MKEGVFQIQEMTEAVTTLMPPEMAERAKMAMETCKEIGKISFVAFGP